jgi:anti-sigma factor (TIGR02949 family)
MKGGMEMTSCADVRENISAYADDELDINERQSFEEHISRCPACKDELEDMLRIIAVCRSMPQQELPEGFRDELHEKLTAVSSRQDNIRVIRNKPKMTVFARTAASIAAGILLIFLGGGIVRFGLFSGGFMSKSSSKAEMTADTSAAAPAMTAAAPDENSIAFSLNASPDADTDSIQAAEPRADAAAGASSMDYGIMEFDTHSEAPAKSIDANRSVAMEARDDWSYKGMDAETAASKYSTITVMTKDIAVALGKINVLAAANNGMAPDGNGITGAVQGSPDIASLSITMNEAEVQKQLQYVFTETDYSTFTAALNDTFGAADVQAGAFVSEDMTDSINVLIDQSVAYDAEIQRLQADNAADNSEEISRLKKEKESIDGQIESIRLNSDFVTVTVYVNIK